MAIAPGGIIGVATVKVEADASGFQRDVRRSVQRSEADPRNKVKTKVEADTSPAEKSFQSLRRTLTSVAGAVLGFKALLFGIKWPAIQAGGILAAQAISQLTAALVAFAGSAGAALGVLAALPSGLAALGAAAGSIMLAFRGIGDAVKASDKSMRGGGRAATDTARQHQLAARRVRDATEARARAVEDAAEREREAQRAVAEAVRDLQEAYEDSAESAEAHAQRVASAQARLANAQKAARQAQQDLTRARQEEAKALQELREELARNEEQYALDEERQQLAVERAAEAREATFADEGSSDRERKEADLRYREEVFRLNEIKRRREENRKAQQEAARATVEGSERVQSAREREAAAAEAVVEAERDLAEARRDQSRAAEESAEAITAAQERLAAAQANVGKVGIENARALRDATENLEDALYSMNEAANVSAGGVDKFGEAMDKLSPAGQRFVRFIIDELQPRIKELQHVAQEGMLPGVQAGIEAALPLFGPLKKGIEETSKAVGDVALKTGQWMGSPMFQAQFQSIMSHNATLIRLAGDAILNLFKALAGFMASPAVQEFVTWLFQGIVRWTEWVRATLEAKAAIDQFGNSKLKQFFDEVKQSISLVLSILGNVTVALFNTFKAGKDTGDGFLTTLDNLTQRWRDWSGSIAGQNSLKKWFEESKPLIEELGKLIGAVWEAVKELSGEQRGGLAETVRFLRTDILPILKDFFGEASEGFREDLLVAIREFLKLFTRLAGQSGPFGGLVKVLGDFAGKLNWLLDNFPALEKAVFGLSAAMLVAKPFQPLLTGFLILQNAGITAKIGTMVTGVKGHLTTLKTFLMGTGGMWLLVIAGLVIIVYLVIKYWDEIKEAVRIALEWIGEKISAAWNWIKETTANIWNGIRDFFIGLWEGLKSRVAATWDWITDKISTAWNWIGERGRAIWNGIRDFLSGLWEGIKNTASNAWNWIKDRIAGIWDGIASVGRSVWENIKNIVMGPIDWLKEKIPAAWNWIKDRVAEAWNGLARIGEAVWEGLQRGAKGAVNFVIRALNGFIRAIERAINAAVRAYNAVVGIPGVPGEPRREVNLPQIQELARGGLVKRKGLALVGERGPELVTLPAGARVLSAAATRQVGNLAGSAPGLAMTRFGQFGAGLAVGGDGASAGFTISNLHVTSQRPDDIAGPLAREMGWLMLTRAGGRR